MHNFEASDWIYEIIKENKEMCHQKIKVQVVSNEEGNVQEPLVCMCDIEMGLKGFYPFIFY